MATFNLLDQLTFYGKYHSNKWNQLIHLIFVPLILWSLLVWLAYAGPVWGGPSLGTLTITDSLKCPVSVNVPLCVVCGYTLFYLVLDPLAGATWALAIGGPAWLTASAFAAEVPKAWVWAMLVHVLSWYMQIHPGHAVLEKRKPALMDSLVQAFALAPLFVWFEVLFQLGYRPGLYKQLKNRVGVEIAAFKKTQAAKLS